MGNKKINETEFQRWLALNNINESSIAAEDKVVKTLNCVGINIVSIYGENDISKIRLLISELILKRELLEIDEAKEYLAVLNLLLCYAEYLREKGIKIDIPNWSFDITRDSLIVALFLSRIDNAVQLLGCKSFKEAFEKTGKVLGQKPSTIKNMRDEYDPYFDNGRVGWYQRPLRASRKEVFEKYSSISESTLTKTAIDILDTYAEKKKDDNKRTRIKIKSVEMKEIKAKKK